jgi:hypothetical protein
MPIKMNCSPNLLSCLRNPLGNSNRFKAKGKGTEKKNWHAHRLRAAFPPLTHGAGAAWREHVAGPAVASSSPATSASTGQQARRNKRDLCGRRRFHLSGTSCRRSLGRRGGSNTQPRARSVPRKYMYSNYVNFILRTESFASLNNRRLSVQNFPSQLKTMFIVFILSL